MSHLETTGITLERISLDLVIDNKVEIRGTSGFGIFEEACGIMQNLLGNVCGWGGGEKQSERVDRRGYEKGHLHAHSSWSVRFSG